MRAWSSLAVIVFRNFQALALSEPIFQINTFLLFIDDFIFRSPQVPNFSGVFMGIRVFWHPDLPLNFHNFCFQIFCPIFYTIFVPNPIE